MSGLDETSWPRSAGPIKRGSALVTPRVRIAGGGSDAAALPLHERIRPVIERRLRDPHYKGAISITGSFGSGKTTALEHLAFMLADFEKCGAIL